jgi:branched-chain amino acid transport system substrate-binding protein
MVQHRDFLRTHMERRRFLAGMATGLLAPLAGRAAPADRPIVLAVDAEFGIKTSTSAQAILLGAETAAALVNAAGGLLGRPLAIRTSDNRGLPARAADNLRELANDTDVIAVMGGKFSPIYQSLKPAIHELRIPYLDPWAAADDITDPPSDGRGYLFRLAPTDSWVMTALVRSARQRRFTRLGLLLPNSGWGRSCLTATERALGDESGLRLVHRWFAFGDTEFAEHLRAFVAAGCEALLLVANEGEGAALVREIAHSGVLRRLPVLSHHGISGGQFFSLAGEALHRVDLTLAQTYSFLNARDPLAISVLGILRDQQGIANSRAVPAPAGLAQAHDLTQLLAIAIRTAKSTERVAVRDALTRVDEYRGLVRHFRNPFGGQRLEALDGKQVFMARYAADGAIERLR